MQYRVPEDLSEYRPFLAYRRFAFFGLDALQSTATLTDAFVALKSGETTYAASDAVIGLYASYSEDVTAYIVALLTEPSGYAVGVSAANADLQTAVGQVVATLSSNGVIDVIEKKWLGTAVHLDGVPMTAGVTFAEEVLGEPETESGAEGEGEESAEE